MNFDKVMSSLASSGVLGGVAGGAVSGALMNSKKARKTAGTMLKVGGIAALGGIAWKAYQGYQSQQHSRPAVMAAGHGQSPQHAEPQPDTQWANLDTRGFVIDAADSSSESRGLLIIRAMIAAASADGHLDGSERGRIMRQVGMTELSPNEKALVLEALDNPPGLLQLAEAVDCPELAAEIYLASAMAVDQSRQEAVFYLDALAYRLNIPHAMVEQLDKQLPAPTQSAA